MQKSKLLLSNQNKNKPMSKRRKKKRLEMEVTFEEMIRLAGDGVEAISKMSDDEIIKCTLFALVVKKIEEGGPMNEEYPVKEILFHLVACMISASARMKSLAKEGEVSLEFLIEKVSKEVTASVEGARECLIPIKREQRAEEN